MAEDDRGDIDVAALDSMITAGERVPALIALVHIPSNCGEAVSHSDTSICFHHGTW